ncbi:MAG: O-antigen ligase family protein [Actinobacteria bacterium]|nr:O-antigen ligase family protein [Actinomycetota bacterium]
MSTLRSRAVGFVLTLPALAAIVWLPLRSGGTDQLPLIGIQAATFVALAVTALRRELRFAAPGAFWAALGLTLVAGGVSTIFSKDLDASVPALIGWLWLGAVSVLIASHCRGNARASLGSALVFAVGIQAFWGFFAWWGGGDPADTQSGTFYSPNQYAGYLLLLAPLLIAPALLVSPRREAAASGSLAAFVCLGVVLSGSRGGMVALGIGALATIGLAARTSVKKALIRSVLLMASTVLMGALLTSPLILNDRSIEPAGGGPLENVALKGSPSPSLNMRLRWVEGAVRIGAMQPFTGSGLGTYGDMLVQVQEPSWFWSRYAHNHYAEAFAEGGALLLLGVIAIPATALLGSPGFLRRSRSPVEASTIGMAGGLLGGSAHLVIDHDWSFPAFAVTFMVLAALAATWPAPDHNQPGKRRWPLAIGIGIVSLALFLATTSRGIALQYMRGTKNEPVGHIVTRLAPYSAQGYARHATEMANSGDLIGASRAIERAISLDQLEPRLRWQAAEIYVRTGRLKDAEDQYLEAIRISPNAPAAYRYAAEFFLHRGESEEAIEVLDQGLKRLSQDPMRARLAQLIRELMSLRAEAAAEHSS